MPGLPEIRVSAVLLRRRDGAVLLVRKRGTGVFMNPGGKPEAGESALRCAVREVAEELALPLDAELLQPVGTFQAAAANEAGHVVVADCFYYPAAIPDAVEPREEIAEVLWHLPGTEAPQQLAPLYCEYLEPYLAQIE